LTPTCSKCFLASVETGAPPKVFTEDNIAEAQKSVNKKLRFSAKKPASLFTSYPYWSDGKSEILKNQLLSESPECSGKNEFLAFSFNISKSSFPCLEVRTEAVSRIFFTAPHFISPCGRWEYWLLMVE